MESDWWNDRGVRGDIDQMNDALDAADAKIERLRAEREERSKLATRRLMQLTTAERERDEARADRDRLAAIVERAREIRPSLICAIEQGMDEAAERAGEDVNDSP